MLNSIQDKRRVDVVFGFFTVDSFTITWSENCDQNTRKQRTLSKHELLYDYKTLQDINFMQLPLAMIVFYITFSTLRLSHCLTKIIYYFYEINSDIQR